MNLTDLQTFSLVAEMGTISAAAKRLGVPKSTVSRRIRRLEDDLGQELLRRSPRSVALTENGKVLHRRSAPSLQELQAAGNALTEADSEPTGTLNITTVPGLGHSHQFLTCIRDYGLRYPKTTINLELTTRLVNLVDEGIDIGLRLHLGKLTGPPSLISRRLLTFSRAMYASPDYIEEMGLLETPDDLVRHRIAAHSIVDVRRSQWIHKGKPLNKPESLPTPNWLINDTAALERFSILGAGITMLTTIVGDSLVDSGKLVRVLPEYEQQGATASLVWPASRHLSPRVRAFIDHAVETMGD